jgi:hypothetical protein
MGAVDIQWLMLPGQRPWRELHRLSLMPGAPGGAGLGQRPADAAVPAAAVPPGAAPGPLGRTVPVPRGGGPRPLHEQFGLACLGAMASGLPVVTTACGSNHEAVRPPNLRVADDAEALAEAPAGSGPGPRRSP